MPRAKKRKQTFEKLQVSMHRRGEVRYTTKYNALEAARAATKAARDGWKATVSGGRPGGRARMTCEPETKGSRTVAKCAINPGFKRRIKGL